MLHKQESDRKRAERSKEEQLKAQQARLEAAEEADDEAEMAKARAKIAKLGGRSQAALNAAAKKKADDTVLKAVKEIGKAKLAKEYLDAEEEIKRLEPLAFEEEARVGSSNAATPVANRISALYDIQSRAIDAYRDMKRQSTGSKIPMRDWLDEHIENWEEERADAIQESLRLGQEARKQISGGEGRKATTRELNRLANQLIKVLPSSMRDKVRVVGHDEFIKAQGEAGNAANFDNDTGQTLGFVDADGNCYIDADNAHVDTPLHEIGIHMLMDAAKQTGEAGLRNAIIEYGKQAPQEFINHVLENYPELEEGSDEFYEEVAAHAFGKAFEDRQAEFAQQNIFQRLLQAIKDFLDKFFNGKYANLDVFDSVEKLGEEEIGQKLYDLVMGGREIANSQMNRNAATYTARLEKLRNSAPVSIAGDEIQPSEDLSQYRKNALEYGKNLRGKYRNSDTGKYIRLVAGSHGGIKEVLEHDYKDIPHLQSIAAIPQIIEKSIYVDTLPNERKDINPGIAKYEYYICGLKIGDEDYTVKAVIGVDVNGDKYYDHKLTNIEKGKLIDELARISTSSQSALSSERTQEDAGGSVPAAGGVESNVSSLSDIKDIRLLSILQNLIDKSSEERKSMSPTRRQIIGEKGARNLAEYRGDSTITDNLETAKQMLADGRDMLDIKRATGWEYDEGDKKWKTETEDAGVSQLVTDLVNAVDVSELRDGDVQRFFESDETVTLDDLFENGELKDELFAAYPQLKGWTIDPIAMLSDSKGGTSSSDRSIYTNLVRREQDTFGFDIPNTSRPATEEEIRSNLIHEIQHAIQSIEGFAAGANKNGKDYWNQAGEVEARNASTRADMPMDERLTSLLSSTEDASGGKIYSFDYSGEMHSAPTTANNTYNAAIAALNTASGDMTAEQWRRHFKDAKVKDKDLDYFLGGSGYREDGEVVSHDEIFDYLERRYYNDNPYAAALGAYAGTLTSRAGVKGLLDDAWRYLKNDIVAYGTIMRDVLRNGGTIDAERNFEHLHNTQASASGRAIARFEQGALRDILDAESALANKLGLDADSAREAIGRYLIALHAPERNRLLTCRKIADRVNTWAKRHDIDVELTEDDVMPFYDGTPTQGMDQVIADRIQDILDEDFATPESRNQSGMADEEAADIAESFEILVSDSDAGEELDDMLAMVRLANEDTAKFALDHGLITLDTYNEYTTRYEHYIPLVGFEDDSDREAAMDSYGSRRADGDTGMNAAVRREARGRKSQSANPVAGIYLRAVNTINNGYENESRMALHKMIMDNVSLKNLFYIEGMEKPSWAENMSPNELDSHSVFVYVNGVPTRMYFNGQQGVVLSNGLDHFTNINRKLNAAISGTPDGTVGNYAARFALWAWNATRSVQAWRSQIVTTLNPIFPPVNFMRDMSFAARQIYIQQGGEAARRWFSNAMPSVQACADYLSLNIKDRQNAVLNGFDVPQEIADAVTRDAANVDINALAQTLGIDKNRVERLVNRAEFNMFVENGGMIGYTQQITEENAKRAHAKAFKRIADGKKAQSRATRIRNGIEEFAQAFENVSRFAAFKAALEGGASPAAAAFAAHEVATNLSRRGTQSLLSGERMFFNATLESLNQVVKNYSNPETRGRQLAMSGVTVAAQVLSMMAVAAWAKALFLADGGDDEKDKHLKGIMARLPEYRKTGEMVIPFSVDNYGRVRGLRVHGAFQYRTLSYATTKVMEAIAGDVEAGEAFGNIIRAYWQEYSPFSGASVDSKQDDSVRIDLVSIIPDAFKPIVDVINNENAFGSAIYNEPYEGTAAAERPDWSNARLGTDKTAIAISRFLNSISGGSGETSKGAINVHPESIEYLFRQFTGAFGQAYSMVDNQIGMSEAERKRYGEQDPLKSRFWYNGERDLGYGLVEEYARNATKAKGMAKLSEDISGFREIGNVPDDIRRDLNRAAQAMGYVTYNQMASAVKKMENQYRDLVRRADDPTISEERRAQADSGAIRLLDAIEQVHYEFAVKLNKTFKNK